jgi:hypothetical protein
MSTTLTTRKIDPATGQSYIVTKTIQPVAGTSVVPGGTTTTSTQVITHPVSPGSPQGVYLRPQYQPGPGILATGGSDVGRGRAADPYGYERRRSRSRSSSRSSSSRSRSRSRSPSNSKSVSKKSGAFSGNKLSYKSAPKLSLFNVNVNKGLKGKGKDKSSKTPKLSKSSKTPKPPKASKSSKIPKLSSLKPKRGKSQKSRSSSKKVKESIESSDDVEDITQSSTDEDERENSLDHIGKKMAKKSNKKRNRNKAKRKKIHRDALIGPHIQGDEHTSTVFEHLQKEHRVAMKTNNAPRAFYTALQSTSQELEGVDTPDEKFEIHQILLDSYTKGSKISLTFGTSSQGAIVDSYVNPSMHENVVGATFVFPESPTLLLSQGEEIVIQLENEKVKASPHHDIFSIGSEHRGESGLIHVPLSLYNEALHSLYHSHGIATPHAIISVRRSNTDKKYIVSGIYVFLDMSPTEISRTHLHVAGFPSISGVQDPLQSRATRAFLHENTDHKFTIHEALSKAVSQKSVNIDVATSADMRIKHGESFIHWGEMTNSLVSYAVIELLVLGKDILQLNDPTFLARILNSDDTGREVTAQVMDILSKKAIPNEEGEASPMSSFPSLLQLLSHTSGLPSPNHLTCEDIIGVYDNVIASLRGIINPQNPATTSSEAPTEPAAGSEPVPVEVSPTAVYQGLEIRFLDDLKQMDASLNPTGSVIGDWDNTTEACLVAMFVRRYAQHSSFPEEAINDVISRLDSSIQLQWGLTIDASGRRVESPNSPYNLTSCASSRRSDLVAFVRRLSEELTRKSPNESAFAIQLSNPIKTKGVPGHRHIAWNEEKIGSYAMIHMGTTESGIHNIIAFILPELDFWGVLVDSVSHANSPSLTSHDELLETLRETLLQIIQGKNLPPVPSLFHKANLLENARYVRTVDEIEVFPDTDISKLIDMDAVYLSPFTDIGGKEVPSLVFEKNTEFPSSRVKINISVKTSPPVTVEVVLDHKRNGFFIVHANGNVGEEVIIKKDYVSFPGDEIFIRDSILKPKLQEYQAAITEIRQRAKKDIFNGAVSVVSKAISPGITPADAVAPMKPLSTSGAEPQENIGISFGGALATGALGGLAAAGTIAAARALWYGPYSPYGAYPPVGIAPGTVWYGPGSPYGVYPPDLWFGYGSPYGLYPPAGLPSYVRWYGPGSPWGYRRPIYPATRWGPRYRPRFGYGYGRRFGGGRDRRPRRR